MSSNRRWMTGLCLAVITAGSTACSAAGGVSSLGTPGVPGSTTAGPALGTSVSAVSSAPGPTHSSPVTGTTTVHLRRAGARVSLTGRVEAGVERGCMVLTDERTGLRVTLSGGQRAVVRLGARVTVVGRIRSDLMSFCQQGPILQVLTVTAR